MAKDHGPGVKNDAQYEELRERGESKEKAARIANTERAGQKGGQRPRYEDWTRDDLYAQARKVGIQGRSQMSKADLIDALRQH